MPSALVYQASHYRGAYWLIAHCPPPRKIVPSTPLLQFELESLFYTKNGTELENSAASVKIDGDIAGKSKIAITKLIQKYIEKQISEEGEMPAKLEWFRKAIDSLKPKPQTNSESELALSELQKQIDELKEKQQAELQSMMEKLSQAKIDAQKPK